jgi:hypothetical protein
LQWLGHVQPLTSLLQSKMPDETASQTYEHRLDAQPVRPLLKWERGLLKALAVAAGLPAQLISCDALDAYRVRDMLDGGMGSIRFATEGEDRGGARFSVAEISHQDIDGVPVSFALNLDDHGEPWEIDSFKADNSPLRQPPPYSEVSASCD